MRTTLLLSRNWRFRRGDSPEALRKGFDDSDWKGILLPHDWAIEGPFSLDNDLQVTRIIQNGESAETRHYGRTGALPHVGVGIYRLHLAVPAAFAGRKFQLEFDGVMSHSTVFINDSEAGGRPYGYSSFSVDATDLLKPGAENLIAVRVENLPGASRWYPGAGIYREVRLVVLDTAHFLYNGIRLRTLSLDPAKRCAVLHVDAEHTGTSDARLIVEIADPEGKPAGKVECRPEGGEIALEAVKLWSPDTPDLYTITVTLCEAGMACDRLKYRYGFRQVQFDADAGMSLNGKRFRMNGVCLHHDFGPLGAAFSLPALRRNFKLLKSIGCNALRTSHNPPDPKFLDLADEMGFVVIDEAFDCWLAGKTPNDYSRDYPLWHRRDLTDLIRRDRNHPSVILWSIGNEINEQGIPGGDAVAQELVEICHALDPDRPVTAGFDRPDEGFANGVPLTVDVAGWNYKPARYREFHERLPRTPQYGSETASTVSSRGYYDFPVQARLVRRENRQCSSFDQEAPAYASTPDTEFQFQDASPWIMGEFVWTGFDYLGEPSPYDDRWPARSSYFGIFDLCGLPKDRAALYKARWSGEPVLHLLPHWNWPEHEGKTLPVHVYTNYDRVELFLNGLSCGIRCKGPTPRLVWEAIPYQPGELTAVALDRNGHELARTVTRTAGEPAAIRLAADRLRLKAGIGDLAFVTVEIIDGSGNPHPRAALPTDFAVRGEGELAAVCNGDPTSLESFRGNRMTTFAGKCVAVIRAGDTPGTIELSVTVPGLPQAELRLEVE